MANPWAGVFQVKTENDAIIVRKLVHVYEQRYGKVREPVEAKIAWNRLLLTPEGRQLMNDVLDWWSGRDLQYDEQRRRYVQP